AAAPVGQLERELGIDVGRCALAAATQKVEVGATVFLGNVSQQGQTLERLLWSREEGGGGQVGFTNDATLIEGHVSVRRKIVESDESIPRLFQHLLGVGQRLVLHDQLFLVDRQLVQDREAVAFL